MPPKVEMNWIEVRHLEFFRQILGYRGVVITEIPHVSYAH